MGLAEREQDPKLFLRVHYALGTTLFYLGEMTCARTHLEQGIVLYDSHPRPYFAINPKVVCLSYLAQILGYGGYPEQALKKIKEALTIAQELSHPYSRAFALSHAALIHRARREAQATQERAEAVIALSEEHSLPLYLAGGTILRGWVLAEQGQGEEGITQIRQGIDALLATGAGLLQPLFLAMLAEACAKAGQVEEGLEALAKVAEVMHHNEERFSAAEVHRIKGELLLAQEGKSGSPAAAYRPGQNPVPSLVEGAKGQNRHKAKAEECFCQAIDIARRQEAKLLELRAATSLSRLWQQQGKKAKARQLLSEIYSWFTEGFDTADLREAKALLDKLA